MVEPRPHLLWLLRHAKAVADPPVGGTDHDRPLANRGRRDADSLGRRLGDPPDRLGLHDLLGGDDVPGMVLCSTATRTVETAERALGSLTDPPPTRYLRSLYGASPQEVLEEVRLVDETVRGVMVVGHNPAARDLAEEVINTEDSRGRAEIVRRGFPTCALAVYRMGIDRWSDADEGTGELVKLVTPPF